jgi:hypothetical protein
VGKLSQSLAKAADEAERLNQALSSLPVGGEFSGPGGSGGGGGGPAVVFNTTVVSPQSAGRTIRTGEGSGSGGRDIVSRAFAYRGLSSAGASRAFIAQIVREFERMLAKGALTNRTVGGG